MPIVIAGGITLGMPEDDFLALAGDDEWEKKEDEETHLVTYTCYLNESRVDYTEVTVDGLLHLVRGIKVVNNEDVELAGETDSETGNIS